MTSKQKIEGNTSSESTKVMARWWFQRCRNDHRHCTPVGHFGRKLPKRLLEVGNSSNGLTLKVIETQPLQNIDYMTLSHCWGGFLSLRLLTANLESFKTSILFSSLPKTFQDAISVVGWFGIRYLWIDALCIIQDSDDDWTYESGCMRDYYKYSFGTIAAIGASNSSEGLFFDRNPTFVPPFRALQTWDGPEMVVVVTAGGSCLETLSKEPLNQRGWFLQERFLSPRTLYFGRDHVSYECQTELSCETWSNIVPTHVHSRSSFALNYELKSMSHDLRNPTSIRNLWRNIVSTYSGMALTRLSDRCVAFAGIAEEIQAAMRDDYVAGMWRRYLIEDLLWHVDKFSSKQRYPKGSLARSQSYLAPSWSWLSLDRAVRLPHLDSTKGGELVTINAEVESLTENKFGAIKHGVITVLGLLVPAVCACDMAQWRFRSVGSEIIEGSSYEYEINIDEGYIEEPDRFLYCLPILDDGGGRSYSGRIDGLLVAPTLKMTAQYRRIGTFCIDIQIALYRNLPDPLGVTETFKAFQSFTLV